MRTVEIQRLAFLKEKQKSEPLNEKEIERLRQLEAKQFGENQKEALTNGRHEQPKSGDTTPTTTGRVDSQGGGEIGGKGSSNERANRNKSNPPTGGVDNTNGGSSRSDGDIGGTSRTKSGEPRGSDDGSHRTSGGDSGSESGDGSETGNIGGSGSQGGAQEVGSQRSINLKPRGDVKPNRKKAANNKNKKNELDSDMIAALLTSGFGLIANASGRRHWEITEDEAESVAVPMGYLIENMTAKQKKMIEKYSNPVMLASAVAGIVVPRIMIDIALMKHGQTKKRGAFVNVDSQREIKVNIGADTQTDIRVGSVSDDGGDTGSDKNASPVNDPIVAGLFK